MNLRTIFSFIQTGYQGWRLDNAPRLAAALSYYTIFSIAPLLIITVSIAGFFLGQDVARDEVETQIRTFLGNEQAVGVVLDLMDSVRQPQSNFIAALFSLALLLFGASNLFNQLQGALNTIWNVQPKPSRGFLADVRDRLLSVLMLLVSGLVLLASFAIDAVTAVLNDFLGDMMPDYLPLLRGLKFIFFFFLIAFLIALIYKVLPNAYTRWHDVWVGAAITSALFAAGNYAITLYFRFVGSAYVAASSLVVLLLWVYYAAQIFLFGAELTQVYANKYGSRVIRAGITQQPDEQESNGDQTSK
jgi:membrane protein